MRKRLAVTALAVATASSTALSSTAPATAAPVTITAAPTAAVQPAAPSAATLAAAKRAMAARTAVRPSRAALARLAAQQVAAKRARVVARAESTLGIRYRWGGTSRRTGFDCSGLVLYSFKGIRKLPRTANQQRKVGYRISPRHAKPGDLVYRVRGGHAYHTAIVYRVHRSGRILQIAAPRTGKRIQIQRVTSRYGGLVEIRRVIR